MSKYRSVRGMVDIFPDVSRHWQFLEHTVSEVLSSYGYSELRLPIVEYTELFTRGIGKATDIVEKEMYTFDDRNDESLSLRPEGTAGCVRAAIQAGVLNTPQRYWYAGPMFRYERPQKGRQRQFHQIGAEAFGVASADMDAELILMTARLWHRLGIAEGVELQLNTIGNNESREQYREALVDYLQGHVAQLDEDSQRRLVSNPLRILDSKNAATQALLEGAPQMSDFIDQESAEDFATLCTLLDAAGVSYTRNTRLVRGLDYYNKTVFEWVTTRLGAQGTVCGGGRYDGLVKQLGGRDTPGVGFAMGMERLVLLLAEMSGDNAARDAVADIYVVAVGDTAYKVALSSVELLRSQYPAYKIIQHTGGGSFKSQMKKADKSGAQVALIWGEDEVAAGTVTVKPMRVEKDSGERLAQQNCPLPDLQALLADVFTTD